VIIVSKRILIATGGTGGHVFPGLAVAEEFKHRGYSVSWLGTESGLEAGLVPKHDIPIYFFPVKGIRGKGVLALVAAPINIVRAIYFAIKHIRQQNPDFVIGMGGFVSGPVGVASRILGKPLVIHEQNAVAGTTNRMLAKIASKALCAFPDSLSHAEVIGNPIRVSLEQIEKEIDKNSKHIRVLVLGGSRGARALNQNVAKAIAQANSPLKIEIKHQCGVGREEEAKAAYRAEAIEAEVFPFIDDMEAAFTWADLCICRAGALTVSEVAAVGLATVMVPYPYAIDDHQTANAQYLEKLGATEIVQETEFSEGKLSQVLSRVLESKERIAKMAANAKQAARVGVAKRFADICETIPGVTA
jgi:UDP-N-acetylglucosamine--N-acetylmuramyl-(pentapeptide) pyrophosphoryl-undecaprenol N-acetylglucosamine transferase